MLVDDDQAPLSDWFDEFNFVHSVSYRMLKFAVMIGSVIGEFRSCLRESFGETRCECPRSRILLLDSPFFFSLDDRRDPALPTPSSLQHGLQAETGFV